MRKIKQSCIKGLLFCLILGMISCSGMRGELKAQPREIPPKQEGTPSQSNAATQPASQPTTPGRFWGPNEETTKTQPSTPTPPSPLGVQRQPPSLPQFPTQPQPKLPQGKTPVIPPILTPAPTPPAIEAQPKPPEAIAPVTPPSTPPSPPPLKPSLAPAGQGVVFNFDNADLYEVIRVMGEILRINYIIDPRVKGVVNIHTSGQISAGEVFPIFQSILRLNGATAVKKGDVYEIVPLSEGKKSSPPSSLSSGLGKQPSEEKYTIQIISLKYIPVSEVSKMIKPFLSDGADIIEHPPKNILIIGDVASNVKKSLDIIGLFDIDIFRDLRVRIYPILNGDVNDVTKEMERIFSSFEISTKSGRGVGITFTPIVRTNSLLVVSSIPDIFEKVEGWLKELDSIPAEESKLSVFVYYVQNAKAKDLADVLKEAFTARKEKKGEAKGKTVEQTPAQRSARPTPTPAPQAAPAAEEGGAVPTGEISIVVDEQNNALVIRALTRDYRSILETIKKLDIYPKQVLIEVFLAEITLDNKHQFGIEWSQFTTSHSPIAQQFTLNSPPPTDPFGQALAAGTNLRYSIVELGGRFAAAINAAASDNRLKVVSSPHILASNNKEAKIQVGSSQPILTNTYTTGFSTGTSTGVVEGTIEYKDIGIILIVTPRVSDGGLVTMEVSVENSTVATTSLGTLPSIPVFNKRTAKTVLSIMEGQTIVIGGLIQDTKNDTKSGVPFLSKIPVLGAVFGYQTYDRGKTELLLMLTPHVISDLKQSNAVTQEFRDKVEGIKKELREDQKKKK
jgi:general secretion pathway protein D